MGSRPVPASNAPRWGAVPAGVGWGALTGAIAALIDVADTGLSGFTGQLEYFAAYALSSLVLLGALLGGALGAWTGAALWLSSRAPERATPWLRALLLGLPGAAFVAWVPTSWISEHWPALTSSGRAVAVGVYAGALLGSAAVAGLAHHAWRRHQAARPGRPRFHFAGLGLVGGLAGASYWADRRVLVDLYEDFHYGLCGAFLAALALFCVLAVTSVAALRSALARRVSAALVGAGVALALAALIGLERLDPDVFGPSSSVVFAKVVSSSRTWSDVDGDGASSIFGGSDCAPFDADVTPGKFDMPGNGLDEDCSGTSAEWPEPEPEPAYAVPDRSGDNVVLITIDALRADHVGAYGYTKNPTTPNIDRLAARSIRFAEAFSPAPKTYDSLPSLLTGLYPSNVPRDYRVKVPKGTKRQPYMYRITDEVQLLPETLRAHGYATAAAHGLSTLRLFGLNRGFDEYHITRGVTVPATDFLRRAAGAEPRRPFFLWLHYYGPHYSYDQREGFDFGTDDVARYDSEIAYEDQQIGLLLDELDALKLRERTIVVLTADHGEEFGDHGGTRHGLRLYRELTRVPLLLHIPGLAPGVVSIPVELGDVRPTLCDVLRLGAACGDHDGRNLLAAVAGKRSPELGAYSELYRRNDVLLMNSLYTGEWHMIYDYKRDRAELYDTARDVTEQHNVARQHPELVQRFRDRLATRPLYRQGQAFRRYQATGDSLVLAQALGVFRHPRLLGVALSHIADDVSSRHAPFLKQLLKRPGLSLALRKRTKELLQRVERTAR